MEKAGVAAPPGTATGRGAAGEASARRVRKSQSPNTNQINRKERYDTEWKDSAVAEGDPGAIEQKPGRRAAGVPAGGLAQHVAGGAAGVDGTVRRAGDQ